MTTKYNLKELMAPQWKPKEHSVITFIQKGDQVLLIHKKTGLGRGLINAPGGRVEKDETYTEAAIRETKEEVNLEISELHSAGILYFQFLDGYSMTVEVFTTTIFQGKLLETREAKPFWCSIDAIPFDKMWKDDPLWIPLMLQGIPFKGYFIFDDQEMLDYKLFTLGGIDELDTENK